jgi:hypothetical protein
MSAKKAGKPKNLTEIRAFLKAAGVGVTDEEE